MGYTILSIRKNNRVRKYILFYADYLNEAWLSEVLEDDTTKIVKQFRCKSTDDLHELSANLSRMGEIVNLSSDQTIEQHLSILDMKLEKPQPSKIVELLNTTADRIYSRISAFRRRSRMLRAIGS